ncbi:MAG: small subunit ribosomal protein S18 [Parcubacteria group bacterium Gr01-1014_18]|nr:MAG: small subunit ribosomal protein S18 [Parcubacteria group bacterium Greene0416_36]TSC79690.1 MAG: small subunit ribosomal protein S18 [Parcubacteria group bacterium Gr01-1014_18]TSC97862.1 MAG: small subunit ribosomal protein S18 [Parcubacteria group bacterium Greene1014_20]TSD06486.1 MAG: small subunit ribosomal protein S18 [Parcubacteria group bacterium Greene0714_2]
MMMNNNKTNRAMPTTKACFFCVNRYSEIDYKDMSVIRRFLSSYAKIMPPRRSGLCSKHQKKLASSVKVARVMALVPFARR